MSKSQHTPGPWHVGRNHGEAHLLDHHRILMPGACGAGVWSMGCDEQTQDANALLIAAAPDLLAALQGARLFVYGQIAIAERHGWPTEHIRREVAEYDAAIAKARGKQWRPAKSPGQLAYEEDCRRMPFYPFGAHDPRRAWNELDDVTQYSWERDPRPAPETAAERDRLKEINADLLAALETVLWNWEHGVPMDDRTPTGHAVKEAIAKARGDRPQAEHEG